MRCQQIIPSDAEHQKTDKIFAYRLFSVCEAQFLFYVPSTIRRQTKKKGDVL